MSYSCSDAVADLLATLVPEDYVPENEEDIEEFVLVALGQIARLKRCEATLREASQIPMPETIGYGPEREAAWRAGWNAALSRVYDRAQTVLAPEPDDNTNPTHARAE